MNNPLYPSTSEVESLLDTYSILLDDWLERAKLQRIDQNLVFAVQCRRSQLREMRPYVVEALNLLDERDSRAADEFARWQVGDGDYSSHDDYARNFYLTQFHRVARREVAENVKNGTAWEGLKANAALLGVDPDGEKPKMVFTP